MTVSGILLICALALSGVAAYYSIVGLASIFAAAFYPVVIMAGILEISKLVVTSWLYQKWNIVPGALKAYLTLSVLVLMFITSLGIFGFLSRAHVEAGLNNQELTLRIEEIDQQKASIQTVIDRYKSQLDQLDKAINIQLQNNRVIQADTMRKQQAAERADIKTKLDTEAERVSKLNEKQTELRHQQQVVTSKIGPIKYVAELFSAGSEADVDSAVRYMIIIITVVFDPLAVLMIIAANMSLGRRGSIPEDPSVASPAPAPAPTVDILPMMENLGSTLSNAIREMQPPPAPPAPPAPDMAQMATAVALALKDVLKDMVPPPQPVAIHAPHPVSHEPLVGQVHWDDDSQQSLRWNGASWVPLPQTQSAPIQVQVDPATIDTAIVEHVVQKSMDAWLKAALGDNTQPKKEEAEVFEPEQAPEVDSPITQEVDTVIQDSDTKSQESDTNAQPQAPKLV